MNALNAGELDHYMLSQLVSIADVRSKSMYSIVNGLTNSGNTYRNNKKRENK